jgi:lipid II:glycine glycyltransferase (peptidoglycan interpeptide bridge formation enzyme)
MEIKEIKDKETWEIFLLDCQEKSFLQSWNWGEFNKMMGDKVWRLGIYEKISNLKDQISNTNQGELVAVAQVVGIKAKRGRFLFVPHGPAINQKIENLKFKIIQKLLEKLKEIAREERADFIRIAPVWQRNEENIKIFKELGFREAATHIHPELTWELDISYPLDKILSEMRKTTRYLIRQGMKNQDLKIEKSEKIDDIKGFNKLYQETVDRHHFVPFSPDYLKNELLAFLPDNQISIFFAKYKEEVLASAMIIFWQNIAFYHQGASTQKYPKVPAAYLLQWQAIKEAKERGCRLYNFWGIAPSDNPRHPWAGLSLFKMGFGGYKKEYLKTQDLPLSSKYWLIYFFEKIRKAGRHL